MIGLYDKVNPDWEHDKKFMGGWTEDFVRRKEDGHSEHSYLSQYKNLYEVTKKDDYKLGNKLPDRIIFDCGRSLQEIEILEGIYEYELPYLRYIRQYLVEHDGSDEFIYNAGRDIYEKIILEDFPKLGLETRKLSSDEVNDINKQRTQYIQETNKKKQEDDLHELIRIKGEEREKKIKRCKQSIKDEIKWFTREYQDNIIKLGLTKLNELGKFYLELATGSGKTYIVFKIFEQLKPDVLFCLSPRLKINKQNIGNKYLSILGKDYEVFNLSEDNDIETFMKKDCKKLIVGCYKSHKRVYEIIKEYNLEKPSIWFDESHNCVEKWTEKLNDNVINYLLKSGNIKHRLFTSASPDKGIVNDHDNIFGKIHSPIKVKELMDLNYLCPLKPMMYYHNTNDIDLLSYSLDNFKELNRKWGLSFHNEQSNAKELFEKHLEMYQNGKTLIKPFLIVSDNYKFVRIDYKYDNLETFEESSNSIAYVVRQCDMGYDYSGIDFLIFSDRKMSSKDIIQCIGRGLRPDKLGKGGTNLEKECILLLPVFIEDEEKNKFKKVLAVLRYLILDLGIDVDEVIEPRYSSSSSKKESTSIEYDGLNSIKAQLIDLLESSSIINPMNTDRLIKFCINHNIQNQKDYNEFKKLNPYLNLKDQLYEYKNFKWKPIVDPNSEKHYASIEECEIKKLELFDRLESEKDEEEMDEIYENDTDEGFKYLHTIDSKFPPYTDLTYFY